MKTINFGVEETIYDPFKQEVENNGMRVAGLFRLFMKSYAEKKLTVANGEVVSVGHVLQEKRPVGRPPQEKEPVKETQKPYKFDTKLDVWDQDYSNATYSDIPNRRWEHKELAQNTYDWLDFMTVGKDDVPFEMFVSFEYFNERPKYSEFDWLNGAYQEFLSRVASFFLLKNGMKTYGFSLKDVWSDALIQKDIWDKYLIAEGKLKENS